MDQLSATVVNLVSVDSIWSIAIRGLIWLLFVTIFAIGVAKGKSQSRIKAEAGFFLLFIILTAITIYLAFGIVPTLTTLPD